MEGNNNDNFYFKEGYKHYYDPNEDEEKKERRRRALLLIPWLVAAASIALFMIFLYPIVAPPPPIPNHPDLPHKTPAESTAKSVGTTASALEGYYTKARTTTPPATARPQNPDRQPRPTTAPDNIVITTPPRYGQNPIQQPNPIPTATGTTSTAVTTDYSETTTDTNQSAVTGMNQPSATGTNRPAVTSTSRPAVTIAPPVTTTPAPASCIVKYHECADDVSNMPDPNPSLPINHASPHFLSDKEPKRDNYKFMGWSTSEPNDKYRRVDYYVSDTPTIIHCPTPNNEINLYAVWVANTYKVNYLLGPCKPGDHNCGDHDCSLYKDYLKGYCYNFPSSDRYTYGMGQLVVLPTLTPEKPSDPLAPTREGFHFAGWYKDPKLFNDPESEVKSISNTDSGDIDLYAKFIDDIEPTGEIILGNQPAFSRFLNTITFGLFFKEYVIITVAGEDDGCGIDKIEYFELETKDPDFKEILYPQSQTLPTRPDVEYSIEQEAVDELFSSRDDVVTKYYNGSPLSGFVTSKSANLYKSENWGEGVVFARITDAAGNVKTVSSEGFTVCCGKTFVEPTTGTPAVYRDYISNDTLESMRDNFMKWDFNENYETQFEYFNGVNFSDDPSEENSGIEFNIEKNLKDPSIITMPPNYGSDFEDFVKNCLFDGTSFDVKANFFAQSIAAALTKGFNDCLDIRGEPYININGEYISTGVNMGKVRFWIDDPTLTKGFSAYCCSGDGLFNSFGHEFLHRLCTPDRTTRIVIPLGVQTVDRDGYWSDICNHTHVS